MSEEQEEQMTLELNGETTDNDNVVDLIKAKVDTADRVEDVTVADLLHTISRDNENGELKSIFAITVTEEGLRHYAAGEDFETLLAAYDILGHVRLEIAGRLYGIYG